MVIVREAKIEDVETIYDLIMAIAYHHDQTEYVKTTKSELEKSGYGDSPEFVVLLAEIDDKVVGYVSYTWNYSIWCGSRYMDIDDLFVLKEYRGQKVGEALMKKAKEVCKSHGLSKIKWEVEQENIKAIAFYKRLGANVTNKGVCRWAAG